MSPAAFSIPHLRQQEHSLDNSELRDPCLACGACCAHFQASFYWAEGDDINENGVPVQLTARFGPFRRMMIGTSGPQPRCIALLGTIGDSVRCSIYARRPSVCRDFCPSWLNGSQNLRCDEARVAWKLAPLNPGQP